MSGLKIPSVLVISMVAASCMPAIQATPQTAPSGSALTPKVRLDAIRRAQVWTNTNIPAMDVKTDVGKTFGRANAFNKDDIASVNFKEWSRMPVWEDSTPGCVGNLPRSWTGTLDHPHIGEPGRKFLADLLGRLTDSQLHDIFEVARFTRRDPAATVDDWVTAFKQKRADIVNRSCSS